jgi:pyruvate kinase
VQKEIVRKANEAGKPVIVATQMLDSMQKNPRPTRAECTDVSNAVFDGADCVMLSGESAKGRYPVQSVATMKRIVLEAERYLSGSYVSILPGEDRFDRPRKNNRQTQPEPVTNRDSVAASVADMAARMNAACIVNIAESGRMAGCLSKFRPVVPIVCFAKNAKQARLLQIHYGVHPIAAGSIHDEPQTRRVDAAVAMTKKLGFAKSGDKVIILTGESKTTALAGGVRVKIADVL